MISLFIAGDVVPMGRTSDLFQQKETSLLFGNIMPNIKNANYSIVNLEAPIVTSDGAKPIMKSGPCLKTTSETIEVLKEAGFKAVTLANNHIFDYGQEGVVDTIEYLNNIGVEYVGAGENTIAARCVKYIEIKEKRLAIINVCEHEFSVSNNVHGGANGIDVIDTASDIIEARTKADYVICIIHGGIEYYQFPTPRMKKWYRHFVDVGADAVINHHQHCFSGYEIYKGKPIFYGLGNFNFQSFFRSQKTWNEGYAVQLELSDNISFKLIPYTQNAETVGIILRDYDTFNTEIELLNDIILDDERLQKAFDEYTVLNSRGILQSLLPSNRILRTLYRRGFIRSFFDEKAQITIKNKLSCESHLELMAHYFNVVLKL